MRELRKLFGDDLLKGAGVRESLAALRATAADTKDLPQRLAGSLRTVEAALSEAGLGAEGAEVAENAKQRHKRKREEKLQQRKQQQQGGEEKPPVEQQEEPQKAKKKKKAKKADA